MPIEDQPARDGANPVLNVGEEIKLSEPRTKLVIGAMGKGEGVLHLTNQRVLWLGEGTLGCGMDYPFITVHAVSRDAAAWPEPCLYCQLRCDDTGDKCEDEEETQIPEFRFVPADSSKLQEIFTVFSEMSALNPDPFDAEAGESDSDLDDDEDFTDAIIGGASGGYQNAPEMGVIWTADDNDAAMEDVDSDEDVDANKMR